MTGETSGTTVTFVVIDGWTITVASVGDSRCILDTQGGVVSLLTVDHRLEENVEERERVTASGGEVGRLNVFGGNEVYFDYFCLLFKKKKKKKKQEAYMHHVPFSYLIGSHLYMVHRLAPFAAGLEDYASLDQLVTQTLENSLCQFHMLSK